MNSKDMPYVAPFIRRLMKDATEEEILEASENLRQHLKILYGMFVERERRERDASENLVEAKNADAHLFP